MSQRKIIKGSHEVIKLNGDDKSDKPCSSSSALPNKPSIQEYHQGELVEYDVFMHEQANLSELENSEVQERARRFEEENDAKIEEFKKKRNIKLQHNYTPYFQKKQEEQWYSEIRILCIGPPDTLKRIFCTKLTQ